MLNDRRRRVLDALVEEYIASAIPVGSRTLVQRYELGCSPATVRNELAILEETGYVVQPHISAGRMPTDTGYRSFVDGLLAMSAGDEAPGASGLLSHAAEVDDLMRETSALLTQLTSYMAVVLAPNVSLARVRRVDLLSMAPRRALVVLITESGQVESRHVELAEEASPERLAEVERALNAALVGKRAAEVRPLRDALAAAPDDVIMTTVIDEILAGLEDADRARLYHVGVPALLAQPEFHEAERALPLLSLIEDGVDMLEMLSEALGGRDVTVRIGQENKHAELGGVSIVATNYGTGDSDGVIGVIGPTRMDYERAIAAVRAVARGLNETLG